MLWALLDDCAVFEVSKVKHADRAIRTHTGKHIPAPACSAKRDVIHLRYKQTVAHMSLSLQHVCFKGQRFNKV